MPLISFNVPVAELHEATKLRFLVDADGEPEGLGSVSVVGVECNGLAVDVVDLGSGVFGGTFAGPVGAFSEGAQKVVSVVLRVPRIGYDVLVTRAELMV